ncbi:MAG: zinc-binding dehydrogenase [Gammaproteobacteria bacterium]|nr:zinc-binding dehydrogenase [Gammaproteobacteria bacterium]MBT4974368.1 zinc-binding dehydrogenase [Gammaproteobacteria bacterium]MBT5979150.1 zinc-binding dehydrogenase [Gammaproteobacteria bacterium]MBT6141617.1 zinc-binding dehydrogenase [Gammaproteobacteria bacterium]
MSAVLTTGHGGYEVLKFSDDVEVPNPSSDQVLIKVLGAGINNTDINTRTAWYSKSVTGETNAEDSQGANDDGSWSGEPLEFPIIQGADCYGEIVAVGDDVDVERIGERVLVRTMQQYAVDYRPYECWTMGSECNGAFSEYMIAFSDESFKIESNWSNAELASIPCAYSTAENLLERSDVKEGEVVLITGASGGVGSAAIQLAKRRGASVVAISSKAKSDLVKEIGANTVVNREAKLTDFIENESIDVVIDLVAGERWGDLLDVLKKGGRYAAAGAIAGPIVELDVRTLYLKDLVLIGCTFQDRKVFENLIGYIERNEITPLVSKTYPLKDIITAQKDFVSKKYVGKLVLLP